MKIDYRYLRPSKAAVLKAWYEENVEIRDSLQIWTGTNATILPIRKISYDMFIDGTGAVVDSSHNPVPLSATAPTVSVGHSFDHAEFQDLKVVYCGYLINHWGHFLMEAVARLWYFLENDPSVDKYVFVIDENENREIRGNYRQFLELIGIWDRLIILNKPVTFREVIVPELAFRNHQYISPKFKAIYDAVVSNLTIDSSWKPYDKIFLSRSSFNKSNLMEFGHEALDSFFTNNGYKIIYPELLSLAELIFYIRNAQTVASISGTPPHHMMFAKDGQQLVVLDRMAVNNDYQICVDYLRNLNVTYIDANLPIYAVRMPGPHIIAYTEHLQRFGKENGNMVPPDPFYYSEAFLKACFIGYMKCYKDNYRYHWFTANDVISYMNCLHEGYLESTKYFGSYLNGSKPFLIEHYFQFHYFKQFIKRVLYKLNLLHR